MTGTNLLVSIPLAWLSLAGVASGAAPPDLAKGLEALRDGRFSEAKTRFGEATAVANAPEGPLLEGFVQWWQLLDRPENGVLRQEMEERFGEAARRAQTLEAAGSADDRRRGLTYRGISMLLLAHSRAANRAPLNAASLARQGHRALSEALAISPNSTEALFAMGAYNYYADNLPLFVKGLRFLLFIPGG